MGGSKLPAAAPNCRTLPKCTARECHGVAKNERRERSSVARRAATRRVRAGQPSIAWKALCWGGLVLLLQLLVPRFAWAQLGTGVLAGHVVDASTHQPVPDVVVTATSPAAQGEQIVVTDATGSFRIPNLPPGQYALRYEVDGYHPFSRENIDLGSTVTLRVDAELLPLTLAAQEVTVVGAAPTVDVGSTRSGVTITQDFTSRVPIAPASGKGGAARSFEQLAEVAPTARSDTYGASIAGTTSIENQYIIDGLSVGDPGFGYNSSPFSIEFIKETSILTGGYLPEYGRGGGGVLDVVTKSGSNEFHGSFFANLTPWQAKPRQPPEQDAIRTYYKVKDIWDIGFDLGGPIIKDKLWFYAGADYSSSTYTLDRDLIGLFTGADGRYLYNGDGLIRSGVIPGTHSEYDATQKQLQYIVKLTFSPSDDDRLEVVHRGTPSSGGGDGDYSIDYETGVPMVWANPGADIIGSYGTTAWKQIFNSFDTSLKWTHSAFEKKLTLDTTVGWHNERSADLAADGSRIGGPQGLSGIPMFSYIRTSPTPRSITDFEQIPDPSVCVQAIEGGDAICPADQYAVGGPQILQDRTFNRLQFREVATLVAEGAGHHIIKAGVELELITYSSMRAYPGGVSFSENAAGTFVNDFRRYGSLTAPDQAYTLPALQYDTRSISVGGFLQDSWAIMDKVTLNAGARYDAQYLYADQGLALALPNQWSPRIGVIYDPTEKGASKIFANYAVYYQSLPLNIVDRAGSGEPAIRSRRSFDNCNPQSPGYPQSCYDEANLVTIPGKSPADPNQVWAYTSVGPFVVDPDVDAPSSSELSLGGEYELIPNGRIGVTYIRRWMNTTIEDMSRDEGSTFFIGNPGRGVASDFPEVKRNYDAGILSFTKTWSDLWLAQASYTLSYLRGNWDGLFRPQTDQIDPGTNSDFDLRSLTVNRYGPLDGDRRHELKLFGARDIPVTPQHHINVGASYRARSGGPTSYLGAHPVYGQDEVFILPRGSGPRLPWQHTIDGHLGYTFLRTETQTLGVTCDIFNLFNIRSLRRTGERYTNRDVQPITNVSAENALLNGDKRRIDPALIQPSDDDPRPFDETDVSRSFGAPGSYLEPISFRVGVKSTF
jgi:outer membrane receptor protein involved in Fe transport